MKKVLLIIVFITVIGFMAYAQAAQGGQASLPTSAQTRQEAQQLLNQVRTNSSQFESNQNALNSRNRGNDDSIYFTRLKNEILVLEARIEREQALVERNLNRGTNMSAVVIDRIDQLIERHKRKMAQLEAFATAN